MPGTTGLGDRLPPVLGLFVVEHATIRAPTHEIRPSECSTSIKNPKYSMLGASRPCLRARKAAL